MRLLLELAVAVAVVVVLVLGIAPAGLGEPVSTQTASTSCSFSSGRTGCHSLLVTSTRLDPVCTAVGNLVVTTLVRAVFRDTVWAGRAVAKGSDGVVFATDDPLEVVNPGSRLLSDLSGGHLEALDAISYGGCA